MSKPMPDAFTKRYGDVVAVVANKKARRFINKSIEPPPRWRSIADSPGNVLKSPEYRALEFENPPPDMIVAMHCALHGARFRTLYWCENCGRAHPMDDGQVAAFHHQLDPGAIPEHATVQ
jgi:hypothetical protein